MKKFLSVLLVVIMALTVLASCGAEEKTDSETEAPTTKDTTETVTVEATDTETAEVTEEITAEAETEEAAGPITEGTLTIEDLVNVELKDGWYTKEGIDTTWKKVELVNDNVKGFLANVSVHVGRAYGDEHAKEWADNTQKNYQGKGSIATEEINGVTYYHLSGVVDDDTQNIYFADINDDYYVEVAIMMMAVEDGKPVFDLISFNK